MSVQSPPVTTQPNEKHPVHPEIERPPDVRRSATGPGKHAGWGRAVGSDHGRGGYVSESQGASRTRWRKKPKLSRFRRSLWFSHIPNPETTELVLPGNLLAYMESPIFARTNGYLLRWYKDIGSRSKRRTAGSDRHSGSGPGAVAGSSQSGADQGGAGPWRRSPPTAGRICARRTWFRSRKPTSRRAAISRRWPTWRPRTRMFAAWSNWNPSRTSTRPFSGVLTRRNVDPGSVDQCGCASEWQRAVRYRARRSAARLRECSAGVRAVDESGSEGGGHVAGISRAEIHGDGGSHRRRDRPSDATL